YFLERVHLLDESVVSAELVAWIRKECGLAELADELDVYVRKHVSVSAFVTTILERTGMYDAGTVKRVERILKEQSSFTTTQRYKKRAEYLYQQGRFRQALSIYSELVEYLSATDDTGRALMYYNMASIYAMDFAYEEAAELYYRSYMLNPDSQTRLAYILAKKMSLSDYAFGGFQRENPEWEQDFVRAEELLFAAQSKWEQSKERQLVMELAKLKASVDREGYHKRMGELIIQLKKDYRRQTKE
ncbi:MAG: tetratricopeptide repeat protein, partial [Lachnospiraceae bacterium]|nr:tetratricopeptide repeat protein [Lachnospiraceae bacterium]